MTVTIDVPYCPLLTVGNPAWVEKWGSWSPADRAAALSNMAAAGIIGAAGANPNSVMPPDLAYPIGHPCRGNETIAQGYSYQSSYGGLDEGDRARAAASLINTFDGGGTTGLPGFGVKLPDWFKWIAFALIAVGVVMLVKKRGRG